MTTLRANIARQLELFSTLRYREFRLYWMGLVSQVTGQQMMIVTIGWLTFELTGSPLTLGIVNLLQALPRIALQLVGGAFADRFDQRLLITIGQVSAGAMLTTLAVLTVTDLIEVWHLAAGAFIIGMVQAFDEPSRQSLFPHLLPSRSIIPAAVPLISMAWQLNRILAPSIAGFVIAASGAGLSFFISAAGASIMVVMVRLLRVNRVERARRGGVLRNVVEGTQYAWREPLFRTVIGSAFCTSFFALGYVLMLPVFAADVFGVDSRGLGLMYSAAGVGAIGALLTVSRLVRAFRPGRVFLLGGVLFMGGLMAFALAPAYPVAVAMLVAAGFGNHLYLSSGEIILQTHVPDALRGRVMGLYTMLWSIMPLGGAMLNAIAEFAGARYALAGGAGLVLVVMLLLLLHNRTMRGATLTPSESATEAVG